MSKTKILSGVNCVCVKDERERERVCAKVRKRFFDNIQNRCILGASVGVGVGMGVGVGVCVWVWVGVHVGVCVCVCV